MNQNAKKIETEDLVYLRMVKELSYYNEKIILEGKLEVREVKDKYFLINDAWNIEKFEAIENFKAGAAKKKVNRKNVFFSFANARIMLEMKYLVFRKLFDYEWEISTLFVSGANNLKQLASFLNEKHPDVNSILELDRDKANQKWLMWLRENGLATEANDRRYTNPIKTPVAKFFVNAYESLAKLLDTRDEWDKKVWDVRNLNKTYGIYYNHASGHLKIDFTAVKQIHVRLEIQKW